MKYLLFAAALLSVSAIADDRLRDVQTELKAQGFFYGTVDGKAGTETSAAIKRYQIRNGMQVTGALNDETLRALGMKEESPAPVKPAPSKTKPSDQVNPPAPAEGRTAPPRDTTRPPPPSLGRGKDLLREGNPAATDEERRAMRPRVVPGDPQMVPPPREIPSATIDDWSTFYHGTPYATAPREVQMGVLRKAQEALTMRRMYRAPADGLPGPATLEALFSYQEQRRLKQTGRLDLATLADMNLLPGRGPDAPPLRPFYNPNRQRDPGVDMRGIIR